MQITKELIDTLCPEHCKRGNCNDENPINGSFDIEETKFRGIILERRWKYGEPECKRCFLIDNTGINIKDVEELYGIKITQTVKLELIQPDVEVIVKEKKKE